MRVKLDGELYDLTDFYDKHPGGKTILWAAAAGTDHDCAHLVRAYHTDVSKKFAILRKYKVDKSSDSKIKAPTAFQRDMTALMEREYKAGRAKITWARVLVHSAHMLFYVWLHLHIFSTSSPYSVLALLLLPWITPSLAGGVSHDASHFTLSKYPWVNVMFTHISMPWMWCPSVWYAQHVISHHGHSNHTKEDIDLFHFGGTKLHHNIPLTKSLDSLPGWLLLAAKASIVQFGYSVYALRAAFGGTVQPKDSPTGLGDLERLPWSFRLLCGGCALVTMIAYGTLASYHGVLGMLYHMSVISIYYLAVTQPSHLQPEAQSVGEDETDDWLVREARSAVDYSHFNPVVNYLSVGLNCQALHHCLPGIHPSRHAALYPEFLAVCARHGIAVAQKKSWWDAATSMMTHLIHINNKSGGTKGGVKAAIKSPKVA